MTPAERDALDRQDREQIICSRCGATLEEYRRGEKCSAALDDPCPGFLRVETIVRTALN